MKPVAHSPQGPKQALQIIKHAITSLSILAILLGSVALAKPQSAAAIAPAVADVQHLMEGLWLPLAEFADQ